MSEDKAIYKPQTEYELTEKDIETLVQANVIPAGTPPAQIKLFARVCAEKNLSPFSKQIHLVPRKDKKTNVTKYTIQVGIDGLRAIAERTGKYAGTKDYIYDEGLTIYEMIKNGRKKPVTATATVVKILPNGQLFEISATARWDEYYPGEYLGFMWDKMPFLMLGKTAEALALRKAFPDVIGGLYSDEEMQQAGEPITHIEEVETIEVEKEQKLTQEDRKKLIELANHPAFEKADTNGIPYRTHILKIAYDKNLTYEKYQQTLRKCEDFIKNSFEELEKKQKKLFALCKNLDEKKLAQIFEGLFFENEGELWNEILNLPETRIDELIKELENGK